MESHPRQKTIVLGHGCKIRRFRGSYTDDTSFIATMLATSKHDACELFRSHGIPVPRQVPVNDVDQAVIAARRIGYPVVIKPNFADMGHGVSVDLNDERSVRNAFEAACGYGLPILVAEQVPGDDYRITLIHGRMVAASRDIPAHVIGDGHSTIDELIAILNRDPRRGRQDYCILTTIVVDDEIHNNLKDQNYTLNSVPSWGAIVWLRRSWRQYSDHTAENVTEVVHPDNNAMFERAARLIGLDLAGIDFVTSDIRRPWTEVGGAILEINPTPSLNSHVRAGTPDILTMVVDTAFPPGDNGRIPTAAIVGPLRAVRLVAEILNVAGYKVGLGTDEGIEIDQIMIVRGNFGGPARVNMVLGDPLTEVAILQFSTAGVIDAGLGLDKATVAAVFAGEKAKVEMVQGPNGFTGPKDCAGLIVKAPCEVVVLNAEDPGCASFARQTRAKRLCWIANSPNHPMLADHIASGDLAITSIKHAGGNSICLWDSGKPTVVAPIFGLGAEDSETMFAVGIAFGLGVSIPLITEALDQKG